ncbi:hypothetical protein RN001_011374 [Aquatica leii]|uniref:DUF7041 domain-containing protein n=1 Tax=Aquatica leii TaxID=1421715 RepID=A0AAN7QI31_9COLE|nr:hypothetical protein RN001_011374 [Aquatica leii]
MASPGINVETPNAPGEPQAAVEEVRQVKLPPFWQVNPTLWFTQVDAQFYTYKVKSDITKYFTVISCLDSAVLQEVSDILVNPPETDKYENLKRQLIERFSDSYDKRLKRLINDIELGDKSPSQLLREMKTLADNKVSDEVLKTLWLQRLPTNIQAILSASSDVTLENMAAIADKIAEVRTTACAMTSATPHIAAVNKKESIAQASSTTTIQALQAQVENLTKMVEQLCRGGERERPRYDRWRSRLFVSHSHVNPQTLWWCFDITVRGFSSNIACHSSINSC